MLTTFLDGKRAILVVEEEQRVTDEQAIFQAFLARFEQGINEFINGDPTLWKQNVSRSDESMIMGAWGVYEKGWKDVGPRYDWAAARLRGARVQTEYLVTAVSGDTAYTVAIERSVVRLVGEDEPAPMALRVAHIFRREPDGWKLVLRHADPLTEKTAPATVLVK